MAIINSNAAYCGLVTKYIGSAYDVVKLVANDIEAVKAVAAVIESGELISEHDQLGGRESVNALPIAAITNLQTELDDRYSKAAADANLLMHSQNTTNPHLTKALDVPYDDTLSGLGVNNVKAALDIIAAFNSFGVVEYTTEIIFGEGDGSIEGDVNATDFTGHDFADPTITTALLIEANHIVSFKYGANLYRWVGSKDITVGVGGAYTTLPADFSSLGTSDHRELTNLDDADQHAIAAVTGLQAALNAKANTSHNHLELQIGWGGIVI